MNPPEPPVSPDFSAIPFVKMHGIGNDFIVLDLIRHPLPTNFDFARFAHTVCDRHFGIGGDGLLCLERAHDENAVRMRMWNPDGSEDMCGNGLRCVALLARTRGDVGDDFGVQTLSGSRQISISANSQIRVAMGAPDFSPARVPLARDAPLIDATIELDGHQFHNVTSLSTGSTHTVIFADAPVSPADFALWSPQLEIAPLFPERTSILWAHQISDARFGIRIWERGAGETLACGTGACAVTVAARKTGRATGKVRVVSKGGELEIDWNETTDEIWKTGPAKIVFEGVWNTPEPDHPAIGANMSAS